MSGVSLAYLTGHILSGAVAKGCAGVCKLIIGASVAPSSGIATWSLPLRVSFADKMVENFYEVSAR